VQLSYKKFREWIFRELCRKCRKAKIPEPKGVYFNAEPLPELASSLDSKARIEEYISKNRKPLNPEGKNVWYSGKQGSKPRMTTFPTNKRRMKRIRWTVIWQTDKMRKMTI
jgi:hypothetical protein